jgi:gamma-glutamyltranspeptidase/glutathione hydrolase
MVFGTPGGDGQTQTHVQVLNNMILFGMRPQAAVEAPRWRSYDDARLSVEPGFGDAVLAALEAGGHEIDRARPLTTEFGGAQLILIDAMSRVRITAADPRREAYGIAW